MSAQTGDAADGLGRDDVPGLLVAVVAVELVGSAPAVVTASDVATWYPTLAAPPLTPPSWVFGPVWTVLFAAIGTAAYLVYRDRAHSWRSRALGLFGAQMAFNVAWSFAFFGAQSPALGLVVILVLDVLVVATVVAFRRVDRRAAVLLVPYLAWVLFATYLTAGFWYLN
ncbi:tryptophan-rich sensory protein [Halorubellus sp. JP-L1]|uniref:TspO/MBR family protein n=1 Tax=Halorubellus sp. JP-L1 TaxID=2715753 RepID=UPI00140AFEE2|nr:TspO/MBR family protein [Halorubellus sp. JP-L1]NHN41661.1 tryptophan-rich sensory protein [Halorubellus sp. JP-L1]